MRLVAADTGPLNYLVLTGYIELLPELFARVLAHGGGCGCAICCRVCAASNAATARASAWAGPGWCAGRLAGAARRITYLLENGRLQEDNRSPTWCRAASVAVAASLKVVYAMPEFSKLIDLPVTRLFRPHLQSLRNIATSDMSEEGTFSVQIGHIHYKAKSLDELLANPLPASIDNFSLHVYNGADPPKLDSNRRLSIDLRSYRSSCFISSHDDEIWFNGKSQQITDFFAAHIP